MARIRTNVDAFSLKECGTLAYCGYMWGEKLIEEGYLQVGGEKIKTARLRSFEKILPKSSGTWYTSIKDVTDHLRFSHLEPSPVRWFRRTIGI